MKATANRGRYSQTAQQYKTQLQNAAKQSVKQKETTKGNWWDKAATSAGNWFKENKQTITTVAYVAGAALLVTALTVATGGIGTAAAATVLVGAAAGGVASAAIDVGLQYYQNGKNFNNYNPLQTLRAASVGTISGAMGGSAASLGQVVTSNALLQTANTFGESVATGKAATAQDYIVNTASGAIAGVVGGKGVQNVSGSTSNAVQHFIGSSYAGSASHIGSETITIFSNTVNQAAQKAIFRSTITSNAAQELLKSTSNSIFS